MSNDYDTIPGEKEIFRGKQWVLTSYGMTTLRPNSYYFEKDRFAECWIPHLSGKNWIDLEDFITVYLVGFAVWPKLPRPKNLPAQIVHGRQAVAYHRLFAQVETELFPREPGTFRAFNVTELFDHVDTVEAEMAKREPTIRNPGWFTA